MLDFDKKATAADYNRRRESYQINKKWVTILEETEAKTCTDRVMCYPLFN